VARGVADNHAIPFKTRLARVVLATLLKQQEGRLRQIARGKPLDRSSLLTKQQASVLLAWHKKMKRDYALAKRIQGDARVIEQLTGVVASEVVAWDRTVPMMEAFLIQFGKKNDPTKSQLDAFLNLPYAPAYLATDRHPEDVRIEFDGFLARAWDLWLVGQVGQDEASLDVLARRLAVLAKARRDRLSLGSAKESRGQPAGGDNGEDGEASSGSKADLKMLKSMSRPRGAIKSLSEIVDRASKYAEFLGADRIGSRYLESLLPEACYDVGGIPQNPPKLHDIKIHYEGLLDSRDAWAREVFNTLPLLSGGRKFEVTQWIVMRGLNPLRLGSEVTVSADVPPWLAEESRIDLLHDAPPEGCLWLQTTINAADSRMAAELAEAHLSRLEDAIAWMHRQPVIARTSDVVVHDPANKLILYPGFHTDERPGLGAQLSKDDLRRVFKEVERMSRDKRPFVKSVARGIALWRKALRLDDLECRFVELWRAFEAIVGPFKQKSPWRNHLHPLILSRSGDEDENTVVARYAVIMKLRNAWAIHTAEERRENLVEFVPRFQLKNICTWFHKDVWWLGMKTADLAMANADAMTREDIARIVHINADEAQIESVERMSLLRALWGRIRGVFRRHRPR